MGFNLLRCGIRYNKPVDHIIFNLHRQSQNSQELMIKE